eukprot:66248_1
MNSKRSSTRYPGQGASATNDVNMEKKQQIMRDLLQRDPINWDSFLLIDQTLRILSHDSYNCSFSWILSHYPPPHVIEVIMSRYQQIIFRDDNSIKATLDIALYLSSAPVVEFIASRYKYVIEGKISKDFSGDFPLHRARNERIAAILLREHPAGVCQTNSDRDLPLHVAVKKFRSNAYIRLLLEYGRSTNLGGEGGRGGILVKNKSGETPLSLLFKQISKGFDTTVSIPISHTDFGLWKTLKTIISACFDFDSVENFHFLHALIGMKCPPEALHLSCVMEPQLLSEQDEKRRSPLSLVAGNLAYPRKTLEHLILLFSRAAHISDIHGRYPLHWATLCGRHFLSGTNLLLTENPIVAVIPDNQGWYPFMLAASSCDSNTDLIYRLLRENPGVIQGQSSFRSTFDFEYV